MSLHCHAGENGYGYYVGELPMDPGTRTGKSRELDFGVLGSHAASPEESVETEEVASHLGNTGVRLAERQAKDADMMSAYQGAA